MSLERIDIRHQLHLPRPRRSTTNPTRKRDHQTAVAALIRAYL